MSVFSFEIIDYIPSDTFFSILKDLIHEGWKDRSENSDYDNWVYYGKVVLKKNNQTIVMEWDNWAEGLIKGHKLLVYHLKKQYNLTKEKFALHHRMHIPFEENEFF